MHRTFWRRSPLSSLSLPQFGLRSNNWEGTPPHPSTENWIIGLKICWARPCPSEQDRFPHSSHQEASKSPLPLSLREQIDWKHNHRKLNKLIRWTTSLSNSMKLWAMPCKATQDRWVIVESSDKMWSTGKEMANYFHFLALRTPWTVWKGKNIWHLNMNSPGQ